MKTLARRIAEEAIVLLKNDENTLPFSKGQHIAFFGRAQIGTLYSGNGSGAAHVTGAKNILAECEKNGLIPIPELKAFYEVQLGEEAIAPADEFDWTKIKELVNSGVMYEVFGKYRPTKEEFDIPQELLAKAAQSAPIALMVIGRNAGGEECDRHFEADYTLTESEKRLIDGICRQFEKVVLVLNTNGLIDLSWIKAYPSIKSILFLGIPGEEGAAALANILTGVVNPSGKLPVTIAEKFTDYPSADHFSFDKDNPKTYGDYGLDAAQNGSVGFEKSPVTVYQEDIYLGYRYFDSAQIKPLFPFGHGLSYTTFDMTVIGLLKQNKGFTVEINIRNTGNIPGKEVTQLYLRAMNTESKRAHQELKAFEKTKLLAPGETQKINLFVPFSDLACYNESRAAYVIEKGDYAFRVGTSSRDNTLVGVAHAPADILVEQCQTRLQMKSYNQEKLDLLICPEQKANIKADIILLHEDVSPVVPAEAEKPNAPEGISIRQLSALCVGYGPGTPFSAVGICTDPTTIYDEDRPLTTNDHPTGYNGYVSPAIKEHGISSVFYKDGPAGIGEIAWPTGMLIACAFDQKTWVAFGDAVGAECEKQQVDIWLAPAVNLQRHPLCGRNFEYFSEDPYLTGICACAIAKGVQERHPVLVCPKHFALNEQETFRRGSSVRSCDAVDSIVSERAARELYLKPFEMMVKSAGIACIMTSFNKINGVFAGGSMDLCTYVLREEWGFAGAVVTDWGDMDIVVDGADAIEAGNDIIMPGGPPVIAQILKGYEEKRVSRQALETAVGHLIQMLKKRGRYNGANSGDQK